MMKQLVVVEQSLNINVGDEVNILTLTDGVGSRLGTEDNDLKVRNDAAKSAIDVLGANWIGAGNFSDNNMDSVPILEIIKFIESFKKIFILTSSTHILQVI